MRLAYSGPVLLALGALLVLAACATGGSSSSSGSPSVRCMDERGRGQTRDDSAAAGSTTRPLFFLLCAQSP